MQVWLRRGDVLTASVAPPVAHSATVRADIGGRQRDRRKAGYPAGMRHEIASVALAAGLEAGAARASDFDLALHIIGSHHGFARPFAPAVEDPSPVTICAREAGEDLVARSDHHLERMDSGVADRFWLMTRRYGWWGLAYLEACLRIAEHRMSYEEENGEAAQ
jgi:CRISPR-associated endonuclease/helicase Cas3